MIGGAPDVRPDEFRVNKWICSLCDLSMDLHPEGRKDRADLRYCFHALRALLATKDDFESRPVSGVPEWAGKHRHRSRFGAEVTHSHLNGELLHTHDQFFEQHLGASESVVSDPLCCSYCWDRRPR